MCELAGESAASEGQLQTGASGLPGIALNIPLLITLALRTIRGIGLCYGFESDTEEERRFALAILAAVGANSIYEKDEALVLLKELHVLVIMQTFKSMAKHDGSKEAFGIVLAEAMACGVPCVATRVGGAPDVVADDETGCLVPYGDADALAAKIRALLSDRALAARMGAAGRARALREFAWDAVVERTETLYREIA